MKCMPLMGMPYLDVQMCVGICDELQRDVYTCSSCWPAFLWMHQGIHKVRMSEDHALGTTDMYACSLDDWVIRLFTHPQDPGP